MDSIYILKNEQLGFLLTVMHVKEKFYSGEFIDQKWLLVAQKQKITDKKEWLYKNTKNDVHTKISIASFNEMNKDKLLTIYRANDEKNLNLSWLQILQLACMGNYTEDNMEKLNNFYQVQLDQTLF